MIAIRSLRPAVVSSALGCALAFALAACGGAAPEAAAPAAKSPDARATEPSTIEQAQAEIAAAQAQLGGASSRFATPPGEPPAADSSRPSAEPMLPPKSSTSRPSVSTEAPSRQSQDVQDRCGSPCRALASMRRAVGALCRMTGNDDTRCVDARRTLADSEGRIAPCSC